LIAEMARANRTWGEERIAAEQLLKLGISVPSLDRRAGRPPRFESAISTPAVINVSVLALLLAVLTRSLDRHDQDVIRDLVEVGTSSTS
jgi:hypothetical protein